jgi:hypothetical protein
VLAYVHIGKEHDALVWLDRDGNVITESQSAILRAAECKPDDPALPRLVNHHPLVQKAVELVAAQEKSLGGSLGRPSSARNRTYTRLKQYQDEIKGTLFDTLELRTTIEAIHNHPLRPVATDELNRQLRGNISDPELAQFVVNLRKDGRLSVVHEEEQERQQPHIICSLGLTKPN